MDEEGTANEVHLEEGYISPLSVMAIEAHELAEELKVAGFPDRMVAQIIAHMLADAVLYRDDTFEIVTVDYDDEDEEDEDDDEGYPSES